MGSSFTCSEREHAEEAEDAEEADPEADACGAAGGTSGAVHAAPQAEDTAITRAPSSLGGFQVVADLQRLLSSSPLNCCSGLPCLLLLLLRPLSSLSFLFLLSMSLVILAL